MKKKFILALIYIIFFFNFNLFSEENNKILKVGLLAPLSGSYNELGNSLLYSLQLALEEIDYNKVFIVPRDSGFNDKDKLDNAIQDLRSQGIKIIIGPITHGEFDVAKKYSDLIFISPSNINPEFTNNIISVGVSLESQLTALINFIKKQKKNKTVIMYPKNQYSELVEQKIKNLKISNIRVFTYSPNPDLMTGDIEILTNYSQRKRSL
jgi:ABC-type branched-subunit amino acid transport system substrate-binding protein